MNLEKIESKYLKNGYVVLKNFYSKNDINFLKKSIDIFIKKNENKLIKKRGDINYSSGLINSIHTLYKNKTSFSKIYQNKKLRTILVKILKKKPKLRAIELFAKPAYKGLASPLHQDNYYWNIMNQKALTVWICLDMSNKNNGGIKYLSGSHLNGLVQHEPSYHPGSSQMVKRRLIRNLKKKFKENIPNLKSGDVCIHDCLVIHGSDKNKSSQKRRGFTLQFKQRYSKYDKRKIYEYRNSLKKQLKKK